jgi:GNAT superfamily N-acetyltransferase
VSAASVRTIRLDESAALRALRLRALAEAPAAVASTLAAESAGSIALAIDDERWVGMAGGYWFERDPGIAQLWGLWVEPAARGRRIGAALVGAIVDWAVSGGATYVRLGIIEPADDVRRFYARLGFVALDDPAPMRTDPIRSAAFMVRRV